jgi:hypothetical protein
VTKRREGPTTKYTVVVWSAPLNARSRVCTSPDVCSYWMYRTVKRGSFPQPRFLCEFLIRGRVSRSGCPSLDSGELHGVRTTAAPFRRGRTEPARAGVRDRSSSVCFSAPSTLQRTTCKYFVLPCCVPAFLKISHSQYFANHHVRSTKDGTRQQTLNSLTMRYPPGCLAPLRQNPCEAISSVSLSFRLCCPNGQTLPLRGTKRSCDLRRFAIK